MNEYKLVSKISDSGKNFIVSVPIPFGSSQITLDKEKVLNFINDKNAVLAEYFGVSKSDYVTWLEQNMSVQCCGTTTKDKRCKNVVTGGNHVSVQDWVKSQGSLCDVHEDKG